jgi:ABC-type glycerol-3-phosphate transport system permease component
VTAISRRPWHNLVQATLLVLLASYSVFPIYMVTVQSLKTIHDDVFESPFYVMHPTFEWYEDLFEPQGYQRGELVVTMVPFLVWAENTAIVFAAALAVILVSSLMAGYALGRLRPPGWQWWRRILLATFLIPQTMLFIPLYAIVLHLHLDDSLLSLVVTYPMLAIPFCAWLFSVYFQKLSPEIEESAYVEGASRFTAFTRIVLPMSYPVLVAAGLFALGVISSDFLLCGTFLPNEWHQTIGAGMATMDIELEDLTTVSGVLIVAAIFAASYVRGLTAAMIEGA